MARVKNALELGTLVVFDNQILKKGAGAGMVHGLG